MVRCSGACCIAGDCGTPWRRGARKEVGKGAPECWGPVHGPACRVRKWCAPASGVPLERTAPPPPSPPPPPLPLPRSHAPQPIPPHPLDPTPTRTPRGCPHSVWKQPSLEAARLGGRAARPRLLRSPTQQLSAGGGRWRVDACMGRLASASGCEPGAHGTGALAGRNSFASTSSLARPYYRLVPYVHDFCKTTTSTLSRLLHERERDR